METAFDGNEFERDRNINPAQLDVECVQQANLFFKWAEREAEARAETEQAKLKEGVIFSTLQSKIREKPEDFGLVKVTEAAISAAVQIHKDYIYAQKTTIETRRIQALISHAVAAMEMKKRMLEALITLHGQQYFAGPSVPHNLVESWLEAEKRRTNNVNEKQKSLTRKRRGK